MVLRVFRRSGPPDRLALDPSAAYAVGSPAIPVLRQLTAQLRRGVEFPLSRSGGVLSCCPASQSVSAVPVSQVCLVGQVVCRLSVFVLSKLSCLVGLVQSCQVVGLVLLSLMSGLVVSCVQSLVCVVVCGFLFSVPFPWSLLFRRVSTGWIVLVLLLTCFQHTHLSCRISLSFSFSLFSFPPMCVCHCPARSCSRYSASRRLGLIWSMSFVGAFRRLTVSRSAMAIAGGLEQGS